MNRRIGSWTIICTLTYHAAAWSLATNDAPAEAGTAVRVQGDAALEEITVTAQRRTEDAQHAALAIDVVSSKALETTGAGRASDIAALVPSLQIGESSNSQQSLFIRGVGNFIAQSYTDPAIGFNVDGVSIARASSMSGVIYDLARIEVLKGPQGTLYGRNATGGAINIIPNLPQIGDTSGYAALTMGNYGEVHPEAAVNLAVTDNSAARVAFTYTRHEGYQTDDTGSANNYAGRAQYLVKFNDDLSVRVAGDYAHDGGSGSAGAVIGIQNPFTGAITPSPLPRDAGNQDPRTGAILMGQYSFLSGRYMEPIAGLPSTDNKYWGVLAEIDWKTPIGTLTVLPSHRESSLDDFGAPLGFGNTTDEHDEQSSLEVRLASDNQGMFRWLLGSYLFHETIDATYQFDEEAIGPIQYLNQGTLSKAEFGRLTFAPIDQLRFSVGVRYTNDYKSIDGREDLLLSVCGAPTTPVPACPGAPLIPYGTSFAALSSQLDLFPIIPNALYGSSLPGAATSVYPRVFKTVIQDAQYTRTTYHAGIDYDLTPHSMLYANWDTGYHAGGFAFANIKPTYQPEYVSAYSIGSKNRFLDEKLELNAEAFYWKYTNEQVSHGASDLDGTYVFVTDNVGASTIKGGEVSFKYLVTPHTVLSADAQYLSAVYTNFTYQTPAGGTNAPPLTSCPFARTDATHYTVNCAGKTAEESPRWSGNLGLQQRADLGAYSLEGEIDARAQSSFNVGFELLPVETQKAFAEVNLSLGISPVSDRWSVVAFVNNLTDRRPYGQAFYESIKSVLFSTIEDPRTEGVRVFVKF
jgi:iron complex outermembrane receptor protein